MQQLRNYFLSGRGAIARPRVRYHRVIGCYTFTLGINLDLLQWAERMRGKKGPRNNGTDDLSSIIIRWMTLLQSIPNILPQRGVQRLQEKVHSREQMAQKKRSPRESLSLILPLKKIGNGTKQSSKVEMSGRLPKKDVEASNWSTHNLHRFGWIEVSFNRKLILSRLRVWYSLFS